MKKWVETTKPASDLKIFEGFSWLLQGLKASPNLPETLDHPGPSPSQKHGPRLRNAAKHGFILRALHGLEKPQLLSSNGPMLGPTCPTRQGWSIYKSWKQAWAAGLFLGLQNPYQILSNPMKIPSCEDLTELILRKSLKSGPIIWPPQPLGLAFKRKLCHSPCCCASLRSLNPRSLPQAQLTAPSALP